MRTCTISNVPLHISTRCMRGYLNYSQHADAAGFRHAKGGSCAVFPSCHDDEHAVAAAVMSSMIAAESEAIFSFLSILMCWTTRWSVCFPGKGHHLSSCCCPLHVSSTGTELDWQRSWGQQQQLEWHLSIRWPHTTAGREPYLGLCSWGIQAVGNCHGSLCGSTV